MLIYEFDWSTSHGGLQLIDVMVAYGSIAQSDDSIIALLLYEFTIPSNIISSTNPSYTRRISILCNLHN